MSAHGKRPICQDTGIVTCFVKVGMGVQWDKTDMTIQEMVDEGTRRAYMNPDNPLRASIVADPTGARKNTKDNTPSVVHIDTVPGDEIEVMIAAKGGGSENKTKMVMLNPSDSIADWVVQTLPSMGAGWCPPGMLGIGVGGTAEKAAVLAKESLMEPVDIQELLDRGPQNAEEELRLEIYDRVNKLGIGAQGLGGLTTVVDVKINSAPTHAASKPVVMIPNCAATRHVHFHLDGTGPADLQPPKLEDWPDITWEVGENVRRVNVDDLTKADIADWKTGETVLLSGTILTGRDAAHKRIQEMLNAGEELPVDFTNKFIYYVGPVDAIGDEAVGPAGPTTATRMDKFSDLMLSQTGVLGSIGKSERGPATCQSIKEHNSVYLMAVGGAAYLVSKAIKKARVVAFEDLGMEAIYEFEVEDMPVTVAVDSSGESAHVTGPAIWQAKIEDLDSKLSK
jgi:fumarate hydratase class I